MTSLLLYPNQLFDVELLPKVQRVYLVEEPLLFGTDKEFPIAYHKAKLVLHRACMRRYAEEVLWPNGYEVEYIECADDVISDTALVKAAFDGATEIVIFDPINDVLAGRLDEASRALEVHVPLRKIENPNFYLKTKDIAQYFGERESKGFDEFYQYMRERFDVLIDKNYKPFGGKWSHEKKSTTKIPSSVELPGLMSFGDNKYVREAITYIELKFPNNPGRTDTFLWPTNKQEANAWMKDFFSHRLENFGDYPDAVDSRGVWLFHSALSTAMNCGLLSTQEVIEAVLAHGAKTKKEIQLSSLEGFIRQVIGWREYVRATYVSRGSEMRTKNSLGNNRRLGSQWYDASTGVAPLDDVITKVTNFAYATHPERQTIVGNLMLLSDIHPDEVYRWYMMHFIDAYDWVVVPNVYGVSQYADGGSMSNKPSIAASNQILGAGNYDNDAQEEPSFWRSSCCSI
jgi:deoxyribodipyrimidine photolyase-related protein